MCCFLIRMVQLLSNSGMKEQISTGRLDFAANENEQGSPLFESDQILICWHVGVDVCMCLFAWLIVLS